MIKKHTITHASIGVSIIILSIIALVVIGPNLAPEFSGSSRLVIQLPEGTVSASVERALRSSSAEENVQEVLETISIKESEDTFTLSAPAISEDVYLALDSVFTEAFATYTVISFESFSPTISQELIRRSILAIVIASFIIILFVGFAFRNVSRPMSSWKYGVVATIALLHDVMVPIGIFSLLGLFTDVAIDVLFVTALLAILGYSINDTIVVFDRIRERLTILQQEKRAEHFEDTVSKGVRQSLRRSVYTSLSTVIPLALIVYFVPVTQWFALTLFIGIVAGTYSSLFFASSLLVLWHRFFPQKKDTDISERSDLEQAELRLRNRLHGVDVI